MIEDSGDDDDPYEQLLAGGSPDSPESWLEDETEPISINYTSGTTGKPKGAIYTHRGAYLHAAGVAAKVGLGYDSVHLWTLPMFHCNGWCLTWGVTRAGAVHVCLRKVEPDRIWDLFESEGVTHYSGAPTVHMSIVNHDKAHPLEQHVTVPTGGSPPTPALLKKMGELNLHPIHLYGLTETYGPIMSCSWQPQWDELDLEEQARLLSRQGHTYNGANQVRVVDDDMQDVQRDGKTAGEVVMRGNGVMLGYHNMEEETEEAFRGSRTTRATSPCGIRTATSSCATAPRTSSSRAGRTSPASRSSRSSPSIRPCSRPRWWRCPTTSGGSVPRRSWSSSPART